MGDGTNTTTTTATDNGGAPAVQANQSTPTATTQTPAPDALQAQLAALNTELESLRKHKAAQDADLKKYRDEKKALADAAAAEKAENEKKMREAGDLAGLLEVERKKVQDAEAKLKELSPKAERLTAHEQRVTQKLEAAKAKGDLPPYIVSAIDVACRAGDVDAALEILEGHKAQASVTTGASQKTPAPPAPNSGGAPASPSPKKKIEEMTVAELVELQRTDPKAHAELIGAVNGSKSTRTIGNWLSGR